MPVPTIVSDDKISGQFIRVQADPGDFSIAPGFAAVGQSIGRTASMVNTLDGQRKNLDNSRWVTESINQELNYHSEWMNDPANNTSEDYAKNYKELADKRITEYEKSAPSVEAMDQFRQRYYGFTASRYNSALDTSAATTISNVKLGITNGTEQLQATYLRDRGIPGLDANVELEANIESHALMIDQQLGTVAPTLAAQLKEQLYIDSIYTAVDVAPDFAQNLLNKSKLDGRTRHTIQNTIDRALDSKNVMNEAIGDKAVDNWKAALRSGKTLAKFDKVILQSFYSRDKAQRLDVELNAYYDKVVTANSVVEKSSGWNIQALEQFDSETRAKIGTDMETADRDEFVSKYVSDVVKRKVETITHDQVRYLATENPVIKSLATAYFNSGGRDTSAKINYFAAIKKFQGPAPDGTSDADRKLYLNLPRNAWAITTAEEAETNAKTIREGSPNEIAGKFAKMQQQYASQEDFQMAYQDMVRLPPSKGIPGEYQLGILHINPDGTPDEVAKDFFGVLSSKDAIKPVDGETASNYRKALDSSGTWNLYERTLPSDNFQNQMVLDQYRSGVIKYAMALAQRDGMSPEKAVPVSISQLLETKMHHASVNDRPLMLSRERGIGRPSRTDADIEQIGARLDLALQLIDPLKVAWKDEFGRPHLPQAELPISPGLKVQFLRDQITNYGIYQQSPDGKSASVYIANGKHSPYELRDTKGRAFVINLDDIEKTDLFDTTYVGAAFPGMSGGVHIPKYRGINLDENQSYDYNATHWPIDQDLFKLTPRK
jgi:hypothetical protein